MVSILAQLMFVVMLHCWRLSKPVLCCNNHSPPFHTMHDMRHPVSLSNCHALLSHYATSSTTVYVLSGSWDCSAVLSSYAADGLISATRFLKTRLPKALAHRAPRITHTFQRTCLSFRHSTACTNCQRPPDHLHSDTCPSEPATPAAGWTCCAQQRCCCCCRHSLQS